MDFLKFSQQKKSKMRKIRQRRIQKAYGYMVGYRIDGGFHVIDKAQIYGDTYLLANDGNESAVFKISDIDNIVKLSAKRLRKLSKYLSNRDNWNHHSYVPINSDGELIQSDIEGRFLRKTSYCL